MILGRGAPTVDEPHTVTSRRHAAADVAATAADRMIEVLDAAGVDTCFGVPGGPIMPLFDAILRHGRMRLVESRHETSAVLSAMGYHRATGKLACVVVTAGPGATNVVTGVVAAHMERVPIVVVCGDVAWASTGRRLLQSMGREGVGIEEMLGGVTRAAVRVPSGRSAAAHMLSAIQAARDPSRPGPALVVLPIDCGASVAPSTRFDPSPVDDARDPSAAVDEGLATEIAERLVVARRPLVVVGAGCRGHEAVVQAGIEALRVPFMTTPQAKGLIGEDHPLSLRNGGMAASWWARRYTTLHGGVDAALVLGTDLDDVATGPTPPVGDGGFLAHVDRDPTVFGRNFPTAIGAAHDVGVFAGRLRDVAASRGLQSRAAPAAYVEATAEPPFERPDFRVDDAPTIAPHRVIHDLERAAGDDAVFFTDIGEHMLFALHYLTARGAGRFAIHLGLGSMTSGICASIGHALGDPRRRVVCICGDGGMQMAGSELLVAIRHRLPVVFAVFNDARYNMVFHGYRQQFGREASWSTPRIDFVAWAGALGMRGARIERPGEITAQLLDELTSGGMPAVLDIRHDADVRIRGAGRIEVLQQMSSARAD